MKNITIFTKPGCDKCERLKNALPDDVRSSLNIVDMSTRSGMALAGYHEVLKDNLPVMVHEQTKIAGEYLKIKRYILGESDDASA